MSGYAILTPTNKIEHLKQMFGKINCTGCLKKIKIFYYLLEISTQSYKSFQNEVVN